MPDLSEHPAGAGTHGLDDAAQPRTRAEPTSAHRYDAFISYSHAADGRLAPALRNGLQRFATPWRVFRWRNPVRALRIFQDQASLSANPALWPTIENALGSATWFILLASPEAANSPWVEKEIDFWRLHKAPERLLIVQTDGEIAWSQAANDFEWSVTTALPRRLSTVFTDEPRWIDARWARTAAQATLRYPRFRDLVAELAAPLRDVPKDELIGEDIRQHRRLNRWRNAAVGVLTTLLIGAITAAVIAFQQRKIADQERDIAEQQRNVAEEQRNEALRNQSKTLALVADSERQRGAAGVGVRIALAGLPRSVASPDRPYVPETESALYRSLQEDRLIRRLTGHAGNLTSASFSPDGRRAVTTSTDNTVRLWDVSTGKELAVWPVIAPWSARFSPDGNRIVLACNPGPTRVLDAETGKEIVVLAGHDDIVTSAAFSPDGKRIVTASKDKTARLWEAATGKQLTLVRGEEEFGSAAFSPDGQSIVTAGMDSPGRLWDVMTGRQIAVLRHDQRGFDTPVSDVAFSPNGKTIATAGLLTDLWDGANGQHLATLSGHEALVWSAEFSPDSGRIIVTASNDTTIRVWDVETATESSRLRGHIYGAHSATFAPDGQTILTTGENDNTAWLWNVAPSKEMFVLRGHSNKVSSAEFSPDGRKLITASSDKTGRLWDASTGQQVSVFDHQGEVDFAFFSSDEKTVTTWSGDGAARRWDVAEGRERDSFVPYEGALKHDRIRKRQLSSNGKWLATISDGTIQIWDVASANKIGAFQTLYAQKELDYETFISGLSGDGRIVATSGLDRDGVRVALWDTSTGARIGLLRGHSTPVLSAAFSPDGRSIATAGGDSTVRLWDVATSSETMMLRGHAGMRLQSGWQDNRHRLGG